jgi:predicted lipoprotein
MERRLMSAVGFDARPEAIAELLAGADPVDADALDDEGAAVRGLYAAETALFGEGSDALATTEGSRRCEYLTSALTLSLDAAEEVRADWSGPSRDTFVAGMDGTPQDTVNQLVNEVTNRVRELDEKGLRDLAAADSVSDLAESRLDGPAAFALAGRRSLLEGIALVIGRDEEGLVALVAARSPETAERLQSATADAVAALDALPDAVAESFDRPEDVQTAADAVAELRVVLSTEAASQLGVTISFSDSDGDS